MRWAPALFLFAAFATPVLAGEVEGRPESPGDWNRQQRLEFGRINQNLSSEQLKSDRILENGFIRACLHNTRQGNHSEYSTLSDRALYYSCLSIVFKHPRLTSPALEQVRFYDAAGLVTSRTWGVAAADQVSWQLVGSAMVRLRLPRRANVGDRQYSLDMAEIKAAFERTSDALFELNVATAKRLLAERSLFDPLTGASNPRLNGFEWDKLMVLREQDEVERTVSQTCQSEAIRNSVNLGLSWSLVVRRYGLGLNQLLDEDFSDHADFCKKADRVTIGLAYIHRLHRKSKAEFDRHVANLPPAYRSTQ